MMDTSSMYGHDRIADAHGTTWLNSSSRSSHRDYYYRQSSPPRHRDHARTHSTHLDPARSSKPARSRSRTRWPPSPYVESERASLAREYNPQAASDPRDVPSRGTIDQEPLMVEVETRQQYAYSKTNKASKDSCNSQEARYGSIGSKPIPRSRSSDVPELHERVPRPYGGNAPVTADPSGTSSTRGGTLHESRRTMVAEHERVYSQAASSPIDSQYAAQKRQNAKEPLDRSSAWRGHEAGMESEEDERLVSNGKRPSRYSFNRHGVPGLLSKRSTEGSGSSGEDTKSSRYPDEHTRSEIQGNRSEQHSLNSSRTIAPPVRTASPQDLPDRGARGQHTLTQKTQLSFEESSQGRGTFPEHVSSPSSHTSNPQSPPDSPGHNHARQAYSSLEPRSRPNSRPASRPTTPLSLASGLLAAQSLSDAFATKPERQATFPLSATEQSKTQTDIWSSERSRIPMNLRTETNPPFPRSAVGPLPYPDGPGQTLPYPEEASSPLPYPVQEAGSHLMPSEAAFQFIHPSLMPTATLPYPVAPSAEPPTAPVRDRTAFDTKHPILGIRRSHTDGLNSMQRGEPTLASRPPYTHPIETDLRSTRAPGAKAEESRTSPPQGCPRGKSVKGLNDWSMLESDNTFNICPDCLHTAVDPTPYRVYFKSAERGPNERIKCDFSRPWIRLSWLLTLQRQLPDLSLVYAASSISNVEEECPGDVEQKCSWYGFVNANDETVRDFYMCGRDRRFVESLLPSLKPQIARISRGIHTCDLDRGSVHFARLLDVLVAMDQETALSKGEIDLDRFTEVVQSIAAIKSLPPCAKDNLMKGGKWHYMANLAEFTVCTRCFAEVIQPVLCDPAAAPSASTPRSLPDQFIRAPQPVPREHGLTRGYGSSCQLYSRRMRDVWARAVAEGDEAYLARKVRERKAVEIGTYETYATLDKLMQAPSFDKQHVKEELDRVKREWKAVE